ncbi:MAG TPA: sugar phosphate isomerase/epimerase [Vicinamibacteria bacterium]|nr:sugar phosphate isomerase/epimerase [Vicinamibacteria bacterium]
MRNDRVLSRRRALQLSASAAAAAWALPLAREALAAGKVPIGVQLFSVRDLCEKDLPGTLRAIKAMGYQGVEFAGYYGRGAAELKKLLHDTGLRCCGTHTGLDTLEGDALAKTVAFNETIGNKFLIVPWIPEERRKTVADWKKLAAEFDAIADKVAAHGMRVGYHNHNFEFTPIEGTTPWDLFFGGTKKAVVMQVDTGNCIEGGGDPLTVLRKYPGRAATIHVKAYSQAKPDAFLGEDEIPWKDVFAALDEGGATEWYIVEYERENQPPLPAIERCLKNLRAMGR